MKSVGDFLNECVNVSAPLPPLDVSLDGAPGCVLASDVVAAFDYPAHDLADGDGYAVMSCDLVGAAPDTPVELMVLQDVRAHDVNPGVLVPGACARVASGAQLPSHADAVVPLEATDRGTAKVLINQAICAGNRVRKQGEDTRAGAALLNAGVRIAAPHLAVLAAQGASTAWIHPAPRVVILAVGDELQNPGRPIQDGNVYDALSHALACGVEEAGGKVYRVGAVGDNQRVLRETIEDQLVRADIIITTGGLSSGGGDTVKEVLSALGSVRFDNIAMWPGRQLGVGTIHDETTVFCLPGNPVAALTAFEIFIRPALRNMAGYKHIHRHPIRATLKKSWESDRALEAYVPVRVVGNPVEGYVAEPLVSPGVTALSAIARANGYAVIPVGTAAAHAGDSVECIITQQ